MIRLDRIATHGIVRAAGFALAYMIWVLAFRLLVLSLITYLLMSSNSRFQDISDVYSSNEIVLMGLGALLFVVSLRLLTPLTNIATSEIVNPHRIEKRFAPGFMHGAVIASGVVFSFLAVGMFRYLGFFIQSDEGVLAVLSVLLRLISLGCLVYCEEFIFRGRIMKYLQREIPDIYAALISSALFCYVKWLQFDLGLMHITTLMLMSLSASIKSLSDGDFGRGAGFIAGLMIVMHPLLGLPILGNECQGILLLKYQSALLADSHISTSRFLTGGAGGPISSFALQLLLCIDVAYTMFRNKKILLNPRFQRIR